MPEVATEPEIAELDLRDYLRLLGRQTAVIAVTALLVVTGALAWAMLRDPSYEARARVLVQVDRSASLFGSGLPVLDPNRVIQTEVLAFDSPQLRDDVRRRIGAAPPVSALQVEQTDVIEIIATAPAARRAADVANAYARAYVDLRRAQAVDDVVSAASQLQAKISDLQRQIDVTTGEQQTTLIDQQAVFRQKLDQLQVDSALQRGGARLISDATAPAKPVSPVPIRTGIVALVFGLLLGVGAALTREYLDESIRTPEDAARVAPGLGVIGLIPDVAGWKHDEALVVSLDAPTSSAAEAFRTLRTSLSFLSLERQARVIQVTSSTVGEGKSTVVANLGVAVARTGRRTVVVDCDFRRPRLHEFFGCDGSVGLSSVLAGEASLSSALVPVAVAGAGLRVPNAVAGVRVPNAVAGHLLLLPAGTIPGDPAELLGAGNMPGLIASLQADGAVVILDSPPVLPVTDALVISGRADATVVVCRAGRSTGKQLRRCIELLRRVKAPLVGLVVNAVPDSAAYGAADYAEGHDRRDKQGREQASG